MKSTSKTQRRPANIRPGSKAKNSPQKPSTKPARKPYKASGLGQKYGRKSNVAAPRLTTVQINLGHLVAKTKIRGDVKKYNSISKILSRIANLPDGHVWSWRYISSIHKGTMQPSKKFVQALKAYMQNTELYKNRRCYFAGRRGVLVAFDASIMIDVISGCLKDMGYKPVSYSRYMEVKRKAVKSL